VLSSPTQVVLQLPVELLDARDHRELIICVGPELARSAGLPSRADLALTLLQEAEGEGRSLDAATLREWIADGRVDNALELLERYMGTRFGRVVERELAERGRPVPPLADAIAALEPQLRAVYTTGLDRLLERAFADAWPSFATAQADLARRSKVIVKLCGTLEFPETWTLTRAALERELGERSLRRQLLDAAYRAHCLLFVGFDVDDVLAERLFSIIDGCGDPAQLPAHFVVLQNCTPAQRVRFEQRALSVVCGDSLQVLAALTGRRSGPSTVSVDLPACPYPGIHPFDQSLASVFHGRRAEISAAASRLGGPEGHHRRWLAIEGSSGVGKSSFVHAGVVPALRRGFAEATAARWLIASMRPGRRPLHALVEALALALLPSQSEARSHPISDADARSSVAAIVRSYRPPNTALLIIVDQLEELVTLSDAGERSLFTTCLATLLEQQLVYLITTMRADFGAALSTSVPALARLLNDEAERYTLAPMSRIGLRAAIAEPAAQLGVCFEPELVERIASDAEQHLGHRRTDEDGIVCTDDAALPLVAHILRGLWDARAADDGVIHAADYEALGGVSGALSRSADALLANLDAGQNDRTKALLLRMVNLEGGRLTRRSLARLEALTLAGGGADGERLLQLLSGGAGPRLLVVRSDVEVPVVDLVHEALLREWGTLRGWIAANRVQLARDEALARRTTGWIDQGKPWRSLPRGPERRELLRGRAYGPTAPQQREYQQAMRRAAWLRVGVGMGLSGLLIGAGYLGVDSLREAHEVQDQLVGESELAQHERDVAKTEHDVVERELEGTRADEATRTRVRKLLLEHACHESLDIILRQLPDDELLLHEALGCQVSVVELARLDADSAVTASSVDPIDGSAWLGRANGLFERWDLGSPRTTPVVELPGRIDSVAVAPAGDRLALASNGQVRVFDRAGASVGSPFNGTMPGFSPDGTKLASRYGKHDIELRTAADASLDWTRSGEGKLVAFEFTTSGDRVLVGHAARSGSVIENLDVDTSAPTGLRIEVPGYLYGLSIAPDQHTLVSIAEDRHVRLWSMATGEQLDDRKLELDRPSGCLVEFSPRGNYLAVGTSMEMRIITSTLEPTPTPPGVSLGSPFSPDERWRLSGNADGSVRLHELASGSEVWGRDPADGYTGPTAWTSADEFLTTTAGGSVVHWRVVVRDHWRAPSSHTRSVGALAFAADDPRMLLSASSKALQVWSLDDEWPLATDVIGVLALADGARRLALTEDGTLLDWGEAQGRVIANTCAVKRAAFDAAVERLVVVCSDGSLQPWQLSGPSVRQLEPTTTPAQTVRSLALSNAGRLALGFADGSIELLHITNDSKLVPDATQRGHEGAVTALRFDPSGRFLLSGSNDNRARLWQVDDGWTSVLDLPLSQANIESVALTRGAERLAAGDKHGAIVVRDRNGDELARFESGCGDRAVTALAFSSDGQRLAAGCRDGQVHAWPLTHDTRLEFACERLAETARDGDTLPPSCQHNGE
jgi:WD40 repeat protein